MITNTIEKLYEFYIRYPQVTTDSRTVQKNSIFFALRGENFDGNKYAAASIESGAAVVVVDDPGVIPKSVEKGKEDEGEVLGCGEVGEDPGRKYFLVDNALDALQQLAAYHRRKLGIPVLAITGSNGKTTTKELLLRTLSMKYHTEATKGNLNNHIGVPLTLLSMNSEVEFGIVEMGANHPGEIALLGKIAQPNYGLITNIGKAHLEGFGSEEGVMLGKGELFDYLAETGGTAFYLKEDDILSKMAKARKNLNAIPYSICGLSPIEKSEYLEIIWDKVASGEKSEADKDKDIIIKTHLVGRYNLNNVSAAIGVGKYFGIGAHRIAEAIAGYIPDNNRSQRYTAESNILILDAYNANPSSMSAAIENFAGMESALPKAVILGDMLELGQYANFEHMQIITLLQNKGIKEAYLVGKLFMDAATVTGAVDKDLQVFENTDCLIEYLKENPIVSRTILIKGSRGIHLEKLTGCLS